MPYSRRSCPTRGCPNTIRSDQRACDEHAALYEKLRGSSTERGYDAAHEALRRQWQKAIDRGEIVYCAKGCGTRITGSAWDLGHATDRTQHTGPECISCNRGEGARKRNRQPR